MATEKKAAAKSDKAAEAKAAESQDAAAASDDDAQAALTEPQTTDDAPAEKEEQPVERERLIESAYDYFGQPPHVIAGTLAGMDGRYSAFKPSEVEAEIDNFLKRPVKEG